MPLASSLRITVVIADDHPLFLDGVSRALRLSGTFEVVGEADNGRSALGLIHRHRPQVAVLDLRMPELDGFAVLRALSREECGTRILVLSAFADSSTVYQAMEEGAIGYLKKDSDPAALVAAVEAASRGQTVVPSDVVEGLAREIRLRRSRPPSLGRRERQVLAGMANGLSIPEIARGLLIEASTAKTHAQRLYEKLGVSNRAAAVAEAMRRGLLE